MKFQDILYHFPCFVLVSKLLPARWHYAVAGGSQHQARPRFEADPDTASSISSEANFTRFVPRSLCSLSVVPRSALHPVPLRFSLLTNEILWRGKASEKKKVQIQQGTRAPLPVISLAALDMTAVFVVSRWESHCLSLLTGSDSIA